jgi:3-dehydroquinate dehydratase
MLARLGQTAVTHLQFEADGEPASRDAVAAITDAGLTPIISRHLTKSVRSVADLRAQAEELTSYGRGFVKIAYWAPTETDWRVAVEFLESCQHLDLPLSVAPMGSRQGRVAAALAGSRLIWVPLVSSEDRFGADWWAQLRHSCEQFKEYV